MAGFDNRAGFTFGDVILAPYSMPEQDEVIQGPSVVVSSGTYNQQRAELLVMAIGVQVRPKTSSGEMAIQNAEAAGLDKGAVFKPVLATVEQRLVRLILGRLEDRDLQSLRHLLDLIVGD